MSYDAHEYCITAIIKNADFHYAGGFFSTLQIKLPLNFIESDLKPTLITLMCQKKILK